MTTVSTSGHDGDNIGDSGLTSPPPTRAALPLDHSDLRARADQIVNRHPAVGFALGVVRDGSLEFFYGHGHANIASKTPVTEETVFRVASITKLFTAIAVMQLWDQRLVDLDAPANDYLRPYKLSPASAEFQPVTLRHLLTHTAGIPEVVHLTDLLHPNWGPFDARPAVYSVPFGETLPSLAEYYRGGLEYVVEPGSAFSYTNHGFAMLGQIIEDVSGMPLNRYFRERIFEPLGMTGTDFVRSERVMSRLATGYVFGPRGAKAAPDRDWVCAGATNVYSNTRDMARFVAALIGGGINQHGSILRPGTLATMFAAHYQPDHRLRGMGLGFFRHEVGGHLIAGHDGILPGFNSALSVAPDDGIGVIAFTNGSSGAMAWIPDETERMMRHLLGVPEEGVREDIPQRLEIWGDLCGRYQLPPRVSDLRGRLAMGRGAQVFVGGSQLMLRVLVPVPALYRGFPLHPDDPDDPHVFRVDLSQFGMPSVRLVFARDAGGVVNAMHTDLGSQPISLFRQPPASSRRALLVGALAGATAAIAVRRAWSKPGKQAAM